MLFIVIARMINKVRSYLHYSRSASSRCPDNANVRPDLRLGTLLRVVYSFVYAHV